MIDRAERNIGMTRQEAIEVLKNTLAYESNFAEAKQMAIKALEKEPSEDCISREQIIEAHYEWCNQHQGETDVFYTWSLKLMKNAPSVVPKQSELTEAYTRGYKDGADSRCR